MYSITYRPTRRGTISILYILPYYIAVMANTYNKYNTYIANS